ncbi:hypothetical protein [Pseudodesulfovibrio tunisiensis]|uniref:hypothetical protein n=1 Tax=Pseudodesulfovibrio tunisiensis TaxID=463192 RepID=UPI001FB3B748|nr:hypothetical protein [Pseudodesulfovibrio tunisiensis]
MDHQLEIIRELHEMGDALLLIAKAHFEEHPGNAYLQSRIAQRLHEIADEIVVAQPSEENQT